jgi:hypothetical protein
MVSVVIGEGGAGPCTSVGQALYVEHSHVPSYREVGSDTLEEELEGEERRVECRRFHGLQKRKLTAQDLLRFKITMILS